jgi:hypothetical protein
MTTAGSAVASSASTAAPAGDAKKLRGGERAWPARTRHAGAARCARQALSCMHLSVFMYICICPRVSKNTSLYDQCCALGASGKRDGAGRRARVRAVGRAVERHVHCPPRAAQRILKPCGPLRDFTPPSVPAGPSNALPLAAAASQVARGAAWHALWSHAPQRERKRTRAHARTHACVRTHTHAYMHAGCAHTCIAHPRIRGASLPARASGRGVARARPHRPTYSRGREAPARAARAPRRARAWLSTAHAESG